MFVSMKAPPVRMWPVWSIMSIFAVDAASAADM